MGIRLLLVDDEEDFSRTVAERLTLRGMNVRIASSGEDALQRMEESPPDVVVLDVVMPGMGGLEILRWIKNRHPSIQVILLSGFASSQDARKGMTMGAFDYLLKPVDLEELVRKILDGYRAMER
ncbi:MAG TPA: response regulator [Syntrophobacteraceae bacterium]|nr:response regulator [Syntrophobacteraceae bacterium]